MIDNSETQTKFNDLTGKDNVVLRRHNKLLISESPLQILPSLALKIGLNEAIMLQQIHYWISNPLNTNIIKSRVWVYKTYNQWQKEFLFWSIPTIRRTISSLEEKKLLICGIFNRAVSDRTRWYTIDYDQLDIIENSLIAPCDQNDHMVRSKRSHGLIKLITSTIPETTTEITSENNNNRLDKRNKTNKDLSVVVSLMPMLEGLSLSPTLLTTWVGRYGIDYVNEKIALMRASNPNNPEGYLNHAIANDWRPATPKPDRSPTATPEPQYPTHEENVAWYQSLPDDEKLRYYQMAVARYAVFETHLAQQKLSVLDANFVTNTFFKMLMGLIGRAP